MFTVVLIAARHLRSSCQDRGVNVLELNVLVTALTNSKSCGVEHLPPGGECIPRVLRESQRLVFVATAEPRSHPASGAVSRPPRGPSNNAPLAIRDAGEPSPAGRSRRRRDI